MPLVTFHVCHFFGFGVRDGDVVGLPTGCFFGLPPVDPDGLGVLASEFDVIGVSAGGDLGDRLTWRFGGLGVLTVGNGDGVGVLAGTDFGEAVTLLLSDFDSSCLRCCDPRAGLVGNGIALGSSTAVGRPTGVGVGVAEIARLGVDAASGNNKRPRRCDTVGPEIGVEVTLGTDVCPRAVTTSPTSKTDNRRYFGMPSERF